MSGQLEEDTYKPKYIQLVDIIRRDILSGNIKRGERLPSEHELMDKYGVSSTTVRKCVDILRHHGLIRRIQGVGTFVSDRPVERSLEKILSFTKNMEQAGLKPRTEVLDQKVMGVSRNVIDQLSLEQGTKVLRLKRLRFGDSTPMMLETRYINLRLCPDIDRHDLTHSLYEIYHHYYGINLSRASQHLRIVYLKEDEAVLFNLTTDSPAFLVTGVTYSDKGEPVEYEESIYRGDEYEFFVEVGHPVSFGETD
jgi:GntR family transcriptional regulator